MAQNRFYRTTPTQFVLPETPLEPLLGALQARQKQYDVGFALADELSNKYIDALPQDRARANELQQGWQNKIDQMVETYQGDYSQMYKDLYSLKRDITKTLSPGGEGAAIQLSKKNYMDRLAEERKRLAKGKITQGQLQAWQDYTLGNYTGVGQMDPVSGAYNVLNPEDVAMYTDPDKILHETLKNLAAEKGGSEVVYDGTVNPDGTLSPNGRWLTKVGDKWEEIKPERVSAITQSTLVGNPQYVNMMSQLARWKGQDATQLISNDVMARAANMATIYSQSNHWTTMDRKANEFALIHARTKATKQALQELLQPGPTMPGLTQNTSMDRFKIKQPFVSKIPNLKSSGPVYIPDSGQEATRVDPQQSDPISYINSSIEQIKAPMLRTAFIETSRQVMKTPGYAKLTDKEKNILLADTWNKKVSSIPTFNQTAIPLENDFLDHYRDQWISGAAKMATYYEINNDGSLGEKVRGVPQPVAKDPAHNMPTNIQVIDGKRGSVLAASSESGRNVKRYLVVGTPWHDRVEENLSGLEALYAPYQGGRAETNINYPLPDGRYVPAKMTVELEPSTLQRVATLETQDGATIIMTDNGYITRDANGNEQVFNGPEHRGKLSSFQADITKSAAAELYRGVGRGSDFFNSYDTKNRYDEQLILSSGLFGN